MIFFFVGSIIKMIIEVHFYIHHMIKSSCKLNQTKVTMWLSIWGVTSHICPTMFRFRLIQSL